MAAASAAIAAVPEEVVGAGAKLVKRSVLALAPERLSGVGKNGAKLGAGYNVLSSEGVARALVHATGPWQLIERDTKAHQIPKQRQSASFVGVYGHAVIPGGAVGGVHGAGGVRTRVKHPGTKGKHPWAKGVDAAVPLIPQAQSAAVTASLSAIF